MNPPLALPTETSHKTVFAVSHIAWSAEEDEAAYDLLVEQGVSHVEIAPGRFWAEPSSPASGSLPSGMIRRGLSLIGFQAILFGKPGLLLFDSESRPHLETELKALAETCSRCGGKYLVFGAPKNRLVPDTMSSDKAFEIAVAFFRQVGRHCEPLGVTIGIEANPAAYGGNFCTHAADVVRLVHAVGSPAIQWHLDTGELAMNDERLPAIIFENSGIISSVHISEPQLGDFSSPWSGHQTVAEALKTAGYRGSISLEMKRPTSGLDGVRRAVEFLLTVYA